MFEGPQTPVSGCAESYEPVTRAEDRKRQYTVKGVDESTLDLMRNAARKDGMKIGAWISSRMKDAANRSLNASPSDHLYSDATPLVSDVDLRELVYELCVKRMDAEERLGSIQTELHEITRSQRTIMEKMLQIMDDASKPR